MTVACSSHNLKAAHTSRTYLALYLKAFRCLTSSHHTERQHSLTTSPRGSHPARYFKAAHNRRPNDRNYYPSTPKEFTYVWPDHETGVTPTNRELSLSRRFDIFLSITFHPNTYHPPSVFDIFPELSRTTTPDKAYFTAEEGSEEEETTFTWFYQ